MRETSDRFTVLLVLGEGGFVSYNDMSTTSEQMALNFADETEVFKLEYFWHAILHAPSFCRVVNQYTVSFYSWRVANKFCKQMSSVAPAGRKRRW